MFEKKSINFIAKEAGVSKSTVSNVINNKSNVSKQTQDKVMEVVNKYNYSQNFYAKQTGNGKQSNMIGLILGDRAQPVFLTYFSTLISSVIQEAAKFNKSVVIYYAFNNDSILSILNKSSSPIDGAIIDCPIKQDSTINQLLKDALPCVLIGKPEFELSNELSYVDADNEALTYRLTKTIFKMGFKKPCLFDIWRTFTLSIDRSRGFAKACKENKARTIIMDAKQTNESFYEVTNKALDLGCDAFLVVSTDLAHGCYKAIKERGLEIGKDVAVCALGYSFDKKSDHHPHLTYAEQDWNTIGIKSVDMLCNMLSGKPGKKHHIVRSKVHYQKSLSNRKGNYDRF